MRAEEETLQPSRRLRIRRQASAGVLAEWTGWLVFAATLIGTALLRLHRLAVPLERDEGEYAYVAQLVLDGVPPFEMAYNMKMPGIYYAYAAILGIGGERVEAIHFGLLLFNLAAIALIFAIGRRALGQPAGTLAAASYAILSILPEVLGLFAHATHFVVVPALAGLLVMMRTLDDRRPAPLFFAGLLLGIAPVMKQHGAAFVGFGAFLLIWSGWRAGRPLARIAGDAALFGVGAVIPLLIISAYLATAGVFARFWFWTVEYAPYYANMLPERRQFLDSIILGPLPLFLGPALPLFILAGLGTAAIALRAEYREQRAMMLGFLGFSVAAVLPGLHLRPHYLVLMLPAVSLMAAVGVVDLSRRLTAPGGRPWIVALGSIALALLLVGAVHRGYLVSDKPREVSWRVYSDFFPETRRLAEALAARSEPDDRIAVLGSEPQIYFYAKRRAATGYLYMYPLMEDHPFARRMQLDLAAELKEGNPRFVVFCTHSWDRHRKSETFILNWMDEFLEARYRLVGLVELWRRGGSQFFWDAEARHRQPRTPERCLTYERRVALRFQGG